MKTEIEALLTAIETINAITPETPTIRGHAITYYLKSLTIDQHNDESKGFGENFSNAWKNPTHQSFLS